MNAAVTLPKLIEELGNKSKNPKALNFEHNGVWQALSTDQFILKAKEIACALNQMGIQKGDRVGLMASPSPRWSLADFGIILAGAVTVPLFANISHENFQFEVSQTEIKVLFLEGQEPWKMVEEHLSSFTHLIDMEDEATNSLKNIQINGWKDLLKRGQTLLSQNPEIFTKITENIQPEDLATIIYTSGSTGVPKGVEMTHANITSLLKLDPFVWNVQKDRYVSILPLAHVYARAINFFMIFSGISIYYCNQLKNFLKVCKTIQPTLLVVVPRLLEKIKEGMLVHIEGLKGFKQTVGTWAFHLAEHPASGFFATVQHAIADKLVYNKFREALGNKVAVIISGGAPLNPEVCNFYSQIEMPIYEGWGLTEAAPITVNRKGRTKVGTVGQILSSFSIKISPEGEILVKGPVVMHGYYKNPKENEKVFNEEGWLKTGDRGTIDEEGYLTILGRLKDLYKTSTGEYVAPLPIEQALSRCPLIDLSMIIAENRRFVSCLIFPNFLVVEKLKKAGMWDQLSDIAFLNSKYVQEEIQKHIDQINPHLNHWEKIQKWRIIPEAPTTESGLLTPSLKLIKGAVLKKYSEEIESMYH